MWSRGRIHVPVQHAVLVLVLLHRTPPTETFECYSCTYTLSADPSINKECILQANSSTRVTCEEPKMCKMVSLFNIDMTHIRSATRDCLPVGENCEGTTCCNMAGPFPLCEQKCQQSLCNDINPETWMSRDQEQSGGHTNETGFTSTMAGNTSVTILWNLTSTPETVIKTTEQTRNNVTLPAHLFDISCGRRVQTNFLHYKCVVVSLSMSVFALR